VRIPRPSARSGTGSPPAPACAPRPAPMSGRPSTCRDRSSRPRTRCAGCPPLP